MRLDCLPPFVPHPWIRGPHLQTLLGYHLPSFARYTAIPSEVALDDGGRLLLHEDRPAAWKPGERVVLMIPGMGGTCRSPYMARIARKLNRRGVRTFRMDQRGCGDSSSLSCSLAHAGRGGDVLAAIQRTAALCPESPIAAVGFSMGGNMLLKALGDAGRDAPTAVDRCFVTAPPIEMERCVRTSHPSYSRWLARYLWKSLREREPLRDRLQGHSPPSSVLEFDARVTAPLCGFRDWETYYHESSSVRVLHRIAPPTWIVVANDDPVIDASIFDGPRLSPTTRIHRTRHGGHVGYLSNCWRDRDMRWLDCRILEWLEKPTV